MQGDGKKLRNARIAMAIAAALASGTVADAFGADAKKTAPAPRGAAKAAANAAPDPNKGFRKKELNFEERVIEGLSNRGYESLSQTGTADALKGEKLYRKRAEFDEDSKSLLREMEYLK